jgi:Zn finger protein HypA/HybF involved in hydrogenase expression
MIVSKAHSWQCTQCWGTGVIWDPKLYTSSEGQPVSGTGPCPKCHGTGGKCAGGFEVILNTVWPAITGGICTGCWEGVTPDQCEEREA